MTATPIEASPQARPVVSRAFVITCLMAGTLMQALDATIANVSLPYMQGSMSASREQITWVLTSYVIASAIMTGPVGWFAARFGRKSVYLVCLIVFTIVSALCGAAQSLEEMVLFRLMQGAAGAALSPLSQSMMMDLYPAHERGKAMAIFGTGVMLGPILGPTLGGYLTDALNWRWVFYVNVPFGLAAISGLLMFPARGIRNTAARFDWTGFALLGTGIGSLQLMLDRGTGLDWFNSQEIVLEAGVAVLGLYLFGVHMFTADKPFIPREMFRDANFPRALFLQFVLAFLVMASVAVLPPYLQNLGGYSVLLTGLVMSPRGFGTVAGLQISGRLTGHIDARILFGAGILIIATSMIIMAHWTPEVAVPTIAVVSIFQGIGFGLLVTPLNVMALATLEAQHRTDGSAILGLMRTLGSAVGISVTTSVVAHSSQIAHVQIASHVTPFNRLLQTGSRSMMWNTALPPGAQSLTGIVERQAEIIAYSNGFLFMSYVCLAALIILAGMPKLKMRTGTTVEPDSQAR